MVTFCFFPLFMFMMLSVVERLALSKLDSVMVFSLGLTISAVPTELKVGSFLVFPFISPLARSTLGGDLISLLLRSTFGGVLTSPLAKSTLGCDLILGISLLFCDESSNSIFLNCLLDFRILLITYKQNQLN